MSLNLKAQLETARDQLISRTISEAMTAPLFATFNRTLKIRNDRTKRRILEEYAANMDILKEIGQQHGIDLADDTDKHDALADLAASTLAAERDTPIAQQLPG